MQRFFMTYLKANIIFFPYGQINIPGTAIPRPVPLTLCVGKPILVPKVREKDLARLNELAELLHRRYYTELSRVFEENKIESSHPDDTLSMQPPVAFLGAADFEEEWSHLLLRSRPQEKNDDDSGIVEKGTASQSPDPGRTPVITWVFGVEEWLCAGFFWVTGFMLSGNYLTFVGLVEPFTGVTPSAAYMSMWEHGHVAFILKSILVWCPVFFILNYYVLALVVLQNYRSSSNSNKKHAD
jgi:hypothetical protein